MTKIRGLVREPRKLGRGKPSVFGDSNDFSLHSLVAANAESGDTLGAGPFGTVVVVFADFGPLTQTRLLETS